MAPKCKSIVLMVVLLSTASFGLAGDWYVSVDGKADGDGSVGKAWDLGSALGGRNVTGRVKLYHCGAG